MRIVYSAALLLLVVVIGFGMGAVEDGSVVVVAQPEATVTPEYYECPPYVPGDPEGFLVCPTGEPDGFDVWVYLPAVVASGWVCPTGELPAEAVCSANTCYCPLTRGDPGGSPLACC